MWKVSAPHIILASVSSLG